MVWPTGVWRESVTTLPDDFECPLRPGGPLPSALQLTDVHTQCPAYLGESQVTPEGIVKCVKCGVELGVETDLDAGMLVEDGAGADEDDDGNMDNPEFNNVEAVLEGELIDETPEEQMRREVIGTIMQIANELFEHPSVNLDEITDEQEREHYELLGNKTTYYGAMLSSHAEEIAQLFMFFSKYGINAFGGERVASRRSAVLAVFLVYRMDEGFVFDEMDMVRLLAQNYKRVLSYRDRLIRARLGEEENETGYYVTLYSRALGFDEQMVAEITKQWDKDIWPFLAREPPFVAMGFVLAAAEHLFDKKISTSKAAGLAGLTRDGVGKMRKTFDPHFRTIKSTS